MIVVDPIYGKFHLAEPIRSLCLTPEVRRLSQIRLLNSLTPSLATLGEIRRFSHTLGVLYLASQSDLLSGTKERDAFSAAVLLHDIGTPPFGHLLEYHLKERTSWNHESVIRQILNGSHVRENSAHQFFAKQTLAFRSMLKKSTIDLALVEDIVSGTNRLSHLLFGTLDFDNLDNVARMNWALGQLKSPEPLLNIAHHLTVGPSGSLLLPISQRNAVKEWLRLRNAAYQVIVFDAPTVAAQAILSDALEIALDCGALQPEDWSLTDEDLITQLMKEKATKKMIARQYLGQLPEQVLVLQLRGTLKSLGFTSRRELTSRLRESLSETIGPRTLGYVFVDHGTFTKKVTLMDPNSGNNWSEGELSQSIILYAFVSAMKPTPHRKRIQAVQGIIDHLRVPEALIMKCEMGTKQDRSDAQQTLNISA
jgi:HD superfamily phosphohydrolase